MSKVFVIHQPAVRDGLTGQLRPQHDLSPALEYGRIVDVLPPGPISQDPGTLKHQVMERLLSEGCHRGDYLLALGDPLAIIIGAFAMAAFSDRLQILKWDRRLRRYLPSELLWDVGDFQYLVKDYSGGHNAF